LIHLISPELQRLITTKTLKGNKSGVGHPKIAGR